MYSPHEVRKILRSCNSLNELALALELLLPDFIYYTVLQVEAFKLTIENQEIKLQQKTS